MPGPQAKNEAGLKAEDKVHQPPPLAPAQHWHSTMDSVAASRAPSHETCDANPITSSSPPQPFTLAPEPTRPLRNMGKNPQTCHQSAKLTACRARRGRNAFSSDAAKPSCEAEGSESQAWGHGWAWLHRIATGCLKIPRPFFFFFLRNSLIWRDLT